jgi:hypothetical protein
MVIFPEELALEARQRKLGSALESIKNPWRTSRIFCLKIMKVFLSLPS